MILGSHNTMSYLRPVWYMRWAIDMARCQSRTLEQQISIGVRAFDLRIRFDRHGNPYFAHGLVSYVHDADTHPTSVLQRLDALARQEGTAVYVRLMLETFGDAGERQETLFNEYCDSVIETCHNLRIRFCYKSPSLQIYDDFNQPYREVFHGIHTLREVLHTPARYYEYQERNVYDAISEGFDGILSMDFVHPIYNDAAIRYWTGIDEL